MTQECDLQEKILFPFLLLISCIHIFFFKKMPKTEISAKIKLFTE